MEQIILLLNMREKDLIDIFGREIIVGDIVAFNPPYYKGIMKGTVTTFTPQKVRVNYIWQGRTESTLVYPSDCCVKPNNA